MPSLIRWHFAQQACQGLRDRVIRSISLVVSVAYAISSGLEMTQYHSSRQFSLTPIVAMPTADLPMSANDTSSDESPLRATQPTLPATKAAMPLRRTHGASVNQGSQQSCLVQIYPPDVVDGMILIEGDQVLIGRDHHANLMLPDNSVSRRHAIIRRTKDGFEIEDLGSTNGTLIGSQPVQKSPLNPGDTIKIGTFLFKFLSAGSVESQYHETVYSALTRDALTGTMNKRYLLETLSRSIATATRQKHPITVSMIDIDFFKAVNDTYGHLVGDEVLKEFGARLDNACRVDDLLARYGGEEFCLVLTGTSAADALEVCERCRQAVVSRPFESAAGSLRITASFGLATLDPAKPESGSDLIRRADQKLYEAKRAGRDRICA